jgi:Formamidopyrimidine-DNA glycosylase
MPELPDVTVYVETIASHVQGRTLEKIRIGNPFIVRSVDPPIYEAEGKTVRSVRRIGKRIAIGLDDDLWIVIHLMIAGRFRWLKPGAKLPGRLGLASFDFENGSLVLRRRELNAGRRSPSFGARKLLRDKPRRSRAARDRSRWIYSCTAKRESHTQAFTDGSDALQWNRQRLFR